jgi:uncharacterized membrane protein (DUF485 family)
VPDLLQTWVVVTRRACQTFRVQSPAPSGTDVHSEEFLARLKRRQLRLSATCAGTFLVALLALPLLNYFLPEAMATRVGGFTLTWLILGVLFFPFVWLIAWIFIRRSIALERAEVSEVEFGKQENRKAD